MSVSNERFEEITEKCQDLHSKLKNPQARVVVLEETRSALGGELDAAHARVSELEGVLRLLSPLVGRLDTDTECDLIIRYALDGELVTCDDCGDTVPAGWKCSCDDGRE